MTDPHTEEEENTFTQDEHAASEECTDESIAAYTDTDSAPTSADPVDPPPAASVSVSSDEVSELRLQLQQAKRQLIIIEAKHEDMMTTLSGELDDAVAQHAEYVRTSESAMRDSEERHAMAMAILEAQVETLQQQITNQTHAHTAMATDSSSTAELAALRDSIADKDATIATLYAESESAIKEVQAQLIATQTELEQAQEESNTLRARVDALEDELAAERFQAKSREKKWNAQKEKFLAEIAAAADAAAVAATVAETVAIVSVTAIASSSVSATAPAAPSTPSTSSLPLPSLPANDHSHDTQHESTDTPNNDTTPHEPTNQHDQPPMLPPDSPTLTATTQNPDTGSSPVSTMPPLTVDEPAHRSSCDVDPTPVAPIPSTTVLTSAQLSASERFAERFPLSPSSATATIVTGKKKKAPTIHQFKPPQLSRAATWAGPPLKPPS